MRKHKQKDLLLICGSFLILGISYWLCQRALFNLHGMRQWPDVLAVASLVVLIISLFMKKALLSVATALGYICGFGIGLLLNSDGVDPGGASTNNMDHLDHKLVAFCYCRRCY